jgi:hypothetical protein
MTGIARIYKIALCLTRNPSPPAGGITVGLLSLGTRTCSNDFAVRPTPDIFCRVALYNLTYAEKSACVRVSAEL